MASKQQNTYFIMITGKRVGPLTVKELKLRGLTADMLVWKEGETGWFPTENYQELKSIVARTERRRRRFEFLKKWRIPIAVGCVLVMLGTLGYLGSGLFTFGDPEFPNIIRSADDEDEQVVVSDEKDDKKLPSRTNPQDAKVLAEYNRLVETLSLERFLAGTETFLPEGDAEENVQVVAYLERIAEETSDPKFKQFATQAIDLWKQRASIGLPRGSRSTSAFDPQDLWNRVHPAATDKLWFAMEREFQKLWGEILAHVKPNLESEELKSHPNLVALDKSLNRADSEIWNSNPAFVNSSGTELKNCTLALTTETPWGLRVTNYYHRSSWSPDFKWILNTGLSWGPLGMQQTDSLIFSVWSDQGYLLDQRILFVEKRQAILIEALKYATDELDRGGFPIVSQLAERLIQNPEIPAEIRQTATELKHQAERVQSSYTQLRRVVDSKSPLTGFWKFGTQQGPVGMKLVELEKSPSANSNLTGASDQPEILDCLIYDPSDPANERTLTAEIAYLPEFKSYAVSLTGNLRAATTASDTSPLALFSQQIRNCHLVPTGDALHCQTPAGLLIDLIPESHPGKVAKLEQWKSANYTWRPHEQLSEQSGFPANQLPSPPESTSPAFGWNLGEIRRTSTNDSQRLSGSITQVQFSSRGTTIYAVASNSWMEALDARSGKLEFELPCGPSIAVSRTERALATVSSRGTILYKRSRRDYEQVPISIKAEQITFLPNGSRLLISDSHHAVKILELDGEQDAQATLDQPIQSLAISSDGQYLVTATADQVVRILDVKQDLKELNHLEVSLKNVESLELSPDNKLLLVVGTVEGEHVPSSSPARTAITPDVRYYEIQLWNREAKSIVHTMTLTRPATCIAVSNDWKTAVTGHPEGPISVWDLTSGQEVHWFVGHLGQPDSLAISPDRHLLLSGGADGNIILWGLPR